MDKLQSIVNRIEPLDQEAMRQAQARQDNLTKPQGSLGLLEELSVKVAGIQGVAQSKINDKVIVWPAITA